MDVKVGNRYIHRYTGQEVQVTNIRGSACSDFEEYDIKYLNGPYEITATYDCSNFDSLFMENLIVNKSKANIYKELDNGLEEDKKFRELLAKMKLEQDTLTNNMKALNVELKDAIEKFGENADNITFKQYNNGTITAVTHIGVNRLSCSSNTSVEALNQLLKLKKLVLENPDLIRAGSSIYISSHV